MAVGDRRERVERVERTPTDRPRDTHVGRVERERDLGRPAAADNTNVNVAPGYTERYPATQARGSTAWAIGKVNQILWFIAAVIEVLLGLRFVLLLIGANPAAPFAAFILGVTEPLVWPFLNLVPSPAARGGPVFEVTTLVAMLVYFLFFLLLTQFLRLLVSRPREGPDI